MGKTNFVGFYKNGVLIKTYPSITATAKYYKVSYDKMYKAVRAQKRDISILQKGEVLRKIHANTYYDFAKNKLENHIKGLEYANNIKFGCNRCLKENNIKLPYSKLYQNYGKCDYCDNNRDVSVGLINKWLRNKGYRLEKRSESELKKLLPVPKTKKEIKEIAKQKELKIVEQKKIVESREKAKRAKLLKQKEERRITKEKRFVEEQGKKGIELNDYKLVKEENNFWGCAFPIILLFGFIIGIIYLGNNTIKERNEIQTVRAMVIDKIIVEDYQMIVYENTDKGKYKVKTTLNKWYDFKIGDSIRVSFNYKHGKLNFTNIEKLSSRKK